MSKEAADRVLMVIGALKAMLPDKVRAYGAAHEVQPRLWRILLEPYRQVNGYYLVPPHVVDQIPRLTRCLDRILRITNAPSAGDLLGESPWLDLAGDAIAGQATADKAATDDGVMSTGTRGPVGVVPGVHHPPGAAGVRCTHKEEGAERCAHFVVKGTILCPVHTFLLAGGRGEGPATDHHPCSFFDATMRCDKPSLMGQIWCAEHSPDVS